MSRVFVWDLLQIRVQECACDYQVRKKQQAFISVSIVYCDVCAIVHDLLSKCNFFDIRSGPIP